MLLGIWNEILKAGLVKVKYSRNVMIWRLCVWENSLSVPVFLPMQEFGNRKYDEGEESSLRGSVEEWKRKEEPSS